MAEYKGANDVVSIDDILDVCGKYITNKDSLTLIKQAYDFIMDKHKDQKRKSGEPYTNHLIWVAYILATLQPDCFMMLWKIVMLVMTKWLSVLV